jgi:hypothetical protein
MNAEEWNPQMARRNSDVFSSALICENLRHLRFNNCQSLGTGEVLKGVLEELGL